MYPTCIPKVLSSNISLLTQYTELYFREMLCSPQMNNWVVA
jgi:hypothetical protein